MLTESISLSGFIIHVFQRQETPPIMGNSILWRRLQVPYRGSNVLIYIKIMHFLYINRATNLAKLPHQLIASLTQPSCVALPWKTWLVPSHLLAFHKCIWKNTRIWRTYRYFYINSLIIAFLVNKSSVEAEFYRTFSLFHGSHIGIPKQWNGGHIDVPNQSCGSWTPIRI